MLHLEDMMLRESKPVTKAHILHASRKVRNRKRSNPEKRVVQWWLPGEGK